MDLLFACPTYGPTEPDADRSRRAAIMHAANFGGKWLGDISTNRMKFDVARDAVAKEACNMEGASDAYVFWCDSDVILPPDAISVLAHMAVEKGYHFVTGIYFQRECDHWPLVAHRSPNKGFQWIARWPEGSVFPADGCGFGCVLTSVAMLQDIGEMWFNYEKFSEDFDFCVKAKNKGYQLMVNSNVLCGHLADPVPVTVETFKQKHPEFWEKKNETSQAVV